MIGGKKPGDRAQFKGISLTETTKISSRFVQREDVLSGESISAGYDFNPKGLAKFGCLQFVCKRI